MKQWLNLLVDFVWSVGDCLSQLANNLLFFGLNGNESLSRRAHRVAVIEGKTNSAWAVTRKVINTIFFMEEDHCADAYWKDVARAEALIKEARGRAT